MISPAAVLAPVLGPAARLYRGQVTRPERWATWVPRKGDILVCTPSKSGTTNLTAPLHPLGCRNQ